MTLNLKDLPPRGDDTGRSWPQIVADGAMQATESIARYGSEHVVLDVVSRTSTRRVDAVRSALDGVVVIFIDLVLDPHAPSVVVESVAVHQARALLDADPGHPWSLAELGMRTALSAKRLCTLFGQQVGQTPHQYLLSLRLERAEQHLAESQQSVTQIAAELGFSSSQHLSQSFRQRTGMTPREYRRREQGDQ